MDATQHGYGDDENLSAAWDFGDETGGTAVERSGGGSFLDFGDEGGFDNSRESVIDSLVDDEPVRLADTAAVIAELPDDAGELRAADAGSDEDAWPPKATVTNPPETVSVTATMDGRVAKVELSGGAASMTESALAEEICVIADLARQRALSIQHSFVLDCFRDLGVEDADAIGVVADGLENGVTQLRSPEQATRAQAEVFATRYVSDD